MSSLTSYKHLHVYALRDPFGPVTHVILLTSLEFANFHAHRIVTVLPLSDRDRGLSSMTRTKIQCRGSGGYAELSCDHYAAIDGMLLVPRQNLVMASASPIHPREEDEIKKKIGIYFGLYSLKKPAPTGGGL